MEEPSSAGMTAQMIRAPEGESVEAMLEAAQAISMPRAEVAQDPCERLLDALRHNPALIFAPDGSVELGQLRSVLQSTNGDEFSPAVVDPLCSPLVGVGDPTTRVPLEPFIRSLLKAPAPQADGEAVEQGEDREAVRVRKVTGDLVLSLGARRLNGMDVRSLTLEVLRELRDIKLETKLIAAGRSLNDPAERVEPLLKHGEVLEVTVLMVDLPVLDESKPYVLQLESLRRMIFCEVYERQLQGVVIFRKLLSNRGNVPIDEVIETGILPRLVEFCNDMSMPELQYEAMWVLTNIAAGNNEQTWAVVDHGAVPVFVSMIASQSPSVSIREQAVWALGNIAGDSPELRRVVVQAGAAEPIAALMRGATASSTWRHCMWTLSNLCRKPRPALELLAPVLAAARDMLYCTDEAVLRDAVSTISFLSDGNDADIEAVLASGVLPRVVELMLSNQEKVALHSVRTVGNICSGRDDLAQRALDAGALAGFLHALAHPNANIRKDACWALSNVASGTLDQVAAIVYGGLLPAVVPNACSDDTKLRLEALYVLANTVKKGTAEMVEVAVKAGCIDAFVEGIQTGEGRISLLGISGLAAVLRAGDGSDALRNPYAVDIVYEYGREWVGDVTVDNDRMRNHMEFIKKRLDEVAPGVGEESGENNPGAGSASTDDLRAERLTGRGSAPPIAR